MTADKPDPILLLARVLQERLAKGLPVVASLVKVMDNLDPFWRVR